MDGQELPPGWAWARLEDVCELNPATETGHIGAMDEVAFIPMAAVAELSNKVDASQRRKLKDVAKGFTRFAAGDVLFAKITPCMENGKIAEVPSVPGNVAYGSTEFHILRPRLDISASYVRHFVAQQHFRDLARHNMSGAVGQQRVPLGFLRDAALPVPPSNEQHRIAAAVTALFDELDEAEAALARAREGVERFRASLLHAACTGQLTAAWRQANPPTETGADLLRRILSERRAAWERTELSRLKAKGTPPRGEAWKARYEEPAAPELADLPDLPAGWAWASLAQLGEFGRGKSKHRPRDDVRLYGDAAPFIQTGDVSRSGGKIEHYTQKYSEFGIAQSKLWPKGTVCITIAANIAASGILGFDACFPDSVVGLTCSDQVIATYVELFIRTARENLEEYAPATAQKNINLEILNTLAVPVPPMPEIKKLVSMVRELFGVVEALPTTAQTELRQSILHAAFTGKLVPQDPADEPAAVLLARLRGAAAPARRARRTPAEASA